MADWQSERATTYTSTAQHQCTQMQQWRQVILNGVGNALDEQELDAIGGVDVATEVEYERIDPTN